MRHLCAISMLAISSLSPRPLRAAVAPIRLLSALGDSASNSQIICSHVESAGVDTAEQHVYLRYRSGQKWLEEEMWPNGDYGDHSRYCLIPALPPVEFALRYQTAAGEFWDSNDANNYRVPPCHVGGHVALDSAYVSGSPASCALVVSALVQNLGGRKQVGIRYSANGGASWRDANGIALDGWGQHDCESWYIRVPLLSCQGDIQFAVYYRSLDQDTEYWDNNFEQNYAMTLALGSRLG